MESSYDIPGIGEVVRRLERIDRRLDDSDHTQDRRHQETLLVSTSSYKELRHDLGELDKRMAIAETTQKLTAAIVGLVAGIFATVIVQVIVQLVVHH